ncbi:MAG: GIY-YIG nuclease family protein [Pseudomonadota bacterium]
MRSAFVYLLASQRNGTLYVGVTNDLERRIADHRYGAGTSFTAKYNVTRLVWYEQWDDIRDAITREKQLKRRPRAAKLALIEARNPDWKDLAADSFYRSS